MSGFSKIVGWVLLASLVLPGLAMAHVLLQPSVESHKNARCHGSGHSAPQPKPVDYRCCQVGHSPAIVQPESAIPMAVLLAVTVEPVVIASVSAIRDHGWLTSESAAPPGLTPLRI